MSFQIENQKSKIENPSSASPIGNRQSTIGTSSILLLIAFVPLMFALTLGTRLSRVADTAHFPPHTADYLVDINTADAATLSLLPGIGPALGQRIVEDRQARGAFASVDGLTRVSGIGDRTAERLRPYVICGNAQLPARH